MPQEDRPAADECIARGQALEDAGQWLEAEALYREALAAAQGYPRACINLGNALHKQNRLKEAADAHSAAIDADAAFAPAYFNLGVILVALGRLPEARRRFEKALELSPEMAAASLQLAALAEREGDLASAGRHLEHAARADPHDANVRCDLGVLLLKSGRLDEARRAFEDAVRVDPGHASALLSLGRLDVSGANPGRASEYFRRTIAAEPGNALHWHAYLMALNVRDDLDAETIAREHLRFGERFARPASVPAPAPYGGTRPIRVGYVSGDFRAHPVAWFIAPVLEHHDPDAFESFCYSNVAAEDELTAHLRARADHWRPIRGRGDDEVVEQIRRDGIDILVDLSGHTLDSRLGVFAARAAAVQVTWLGYLNTTGLRTMDYRLVDAHTDPEGADGLGSERLARMPHSQWCWAPHYDIPLTAMPSGPARPVTFGSFNSIGKISDRCLDLWCEILRRVPQARLRIYAVDSPAYGELQVQRLEARGIARSRVTTIGWLPIEAYFRAFDEVDIALDTLPYNGGTTTFVTYWMGVPMVALAGSRGISRSSYSIAKSAGFEELIASSDTDYVERNAALARDAAARHALRSQLRPRLEASVLMDAERFTRDLETVYRGMLEAQPR
jgi:protein O-GlcNAc transferase